MATVGIVVAVLALAPLIAPLVARWLGGLAPTVRRKAFAVMVAGPVLVLAGLLLNLRLTEWTANVVLLAAAYMALAVLWMSCFRLRPRPLGIALGVLGCVPLVAGALAGTVGFLGVGWVVLGQQPAHRQAMLDGTVCRVTILGSAASPAVERGYAVSMRLPLLPWVEHVQSTRHLPLYALDPSVIGHPELLCAVPSEPANPAPST